MADMTPWTCPIFSPCTSGAYCAGLGQDEGTMNQFTQKISLEHKTDIIYRANSQPHHQISQVYKLSVAAGSVPIPKKSHTKPDKTAK